ncbi:mucin-5AC-like isoform X2 [Lethenteron reissneri]|uniref:mucin-5AC-like isoform X2 n=1 Tax=Lethenteron reissneri TaxID=7753 RepID=UPI002AB6D4EE|nr:mucin-5AC-like isoform X2 [Lethenteron reissneri]
MVLPPGIVPQPKDDIPYTSPMFAGAEQVIAESLPPALTAVDPQPRFDVNSSRPETFANRKPSAATTEPLGPESPATSVQAPAQFSRDLSVTGDSDLRAFTAPGDAREEARLFLSGDEQGRSNSVPIVDRTSTTSETSAQRSHNPPGPPHPTRGQSSRVVHASQCCATTGATSESSSVTMVASPDPDGQSGAAAAAAGIPLARKLEDVWGQEMPDPETTTVPVPTTNKLNDIYKVPPTSPFSASHADLQAARDVVATEQRGRPSVPSFTSGDAAPLAQPSSAEHRGAAAAANTKREETSHILWGTAREITRAAASDYEKLRLSFLDAVKTNEVGVAREAATPSRTAAPVQVKHPGGPGGRASIDEVTHAHGEVHLTAGVVESRLGLSDGAKILQVADDSKPTQSVQLLITSHGHEHLTSSRQSGANDRLLGNVLEDNTTQQRSLQAHPTVPARVTGGHLMSALFRPGMLAWQDVRSGTAPRSTVPSSEPTASRLSVIDSHGNISKTFAPAPTTLPWAGRHATPQTAAQEKPQPTDSSETVSTPNTRAQTPCPTVTPSARAKDGEVPQFAQKHADDETSLGAASLSARTAAARLRVWPPPRPTQQASSRLITTTTTAAAAAAAPARADEATRLETGGPRGNVNYSGGSKVWAAPRHDATARVSLGSVPQVQAQAVTTNEHDSVVTPTLAALTPGLTASAGPAHGGASQTTLHPIAGAIENSSSDVMDRMDSSIGVTTPGLLTGSLATRMEESVFHERSERPENPQDTTQPRLSEQHLNTQPPDMPELRTPIAGSQETPEFTSKPTLHLQPHLNRAVSTSLPRTRTKLDLIAASTEEIHAASHGKPPVTSPSGPIAGELGTTARQSATALTSRRPHGTRHAAVVSRPTTDAEKLVSSTSGAELRWESGTNLGGDTQTPALPAPTDSSRGHPEPPLGSTAEPPPDGSEPLPVDTCGGVLAWTRAGEIRSPGFPRAYPSGADCTWEVRAPPEFTLRLAVQALGLEERRHCDYDSLSVYDGTGAGRRLLGRFCGFKLPLPLHSSGNSLTLVLKSDASVEHEGFSAKLTLVKRPRPAVLESCAALREAGVLLSGRYTVDPDGPRGKAAPFEVFCDMTSDPASGVTEVGHDSEARMRVSPCEEAGCYRRDVRYDAKFHQIRALVAVSSDCEQHVKQCAERPRMSETFSLRRSSTVATSASWGPAGDGGCRGTDGGCSTGEGPSRAAGSVRAA